MTNDGFILLAEQFAAATKKKREIEARKKEINSELAELEKQLVAIHALSGIGSSVKLAEGGTLIVSEKTEAKKTDMDKLVAWLDSHNLSEMAQRTVNHNSLGALVRERLEKGEPAPEGCEVVKFKKVSWRQ